MLKDLVALARCHADRALAVIAALVGIAFAVGGWVGVSDATLTAEQLPYLASGAVGAVLALGIAATLWLSADLRDEWAELHELRRRLEEGRPDGPEGARPLRAERVEP